MIDKVHKGDIANVELEVTPEMLAAGEDVILCEVGGAELGGYFSARDLAIRVYRAMGSVREKRGQS